ncbi:hypothetical protein SAMN03159343_3893 [Klenkia marina]|uniref:Uncharacterized protein n=1 Tax=Klenkia marina TaxID=1960309 RepID=A0A1G4Z0D4_9ACTN|nr:hypothetical protein [Klenkia marina]SCX59096.1 hypothetical protein SAMN03159343_3893 [Klenkia marina]
MTRAPYLGLSVVCAAGLNTVSLAGMARRLATAAPLVGGDLDAAVRWYAGAIALLPLTAGGLAFLGLALAAPGHCGTGGRPSPGRWPCCCSRPRR